MTSGERPLVGAKRGRVRPGWRTLFLLGFAASVAWKAYPAPVIGPQFIKLYKLRPNEGVFAYVRSSPDGATLAYASQLLAPSNAERQIKIVDLATERVLFSDGHYLMRENPVRGYQVQKEENVRRPIATQDRFEALRAKSDQDGVLPEVGHT